MAVALGDVGNRGTQACLARAARQSGEERLSIRDMAILGLIVMLAHKEIVITKLVGLFVLVEPFVESALLLTRVPGLALRRLGHRPKREHAELHALLPGRRNRSGKKPSVA